MLPKNKYFTPILVILALFMISLMIRLPYLGKPIHGHHEWITAHTLFVMQNWEARGALKHKFRLLMTSPNDTDIGIMHDFKAAVNNQGYSYYSSFPPEAVILPYLIFKLFFLPISVLSLEIFNLSCHLISAFILFFLLIKILKPSPYPEKTAALCGIFYFFMLPLHLWFFSNAYSWDIFWYYIFIAALAVTLNLIERISEHKPYASSLTALGISLFLLVYSDFYGLLYMLTVILFAAFQLRREKTYAKVIGVAFGSSLTAILIILAQYATITGLEIRLRDWLDLRSGYLFRGISDIKDILNHIKISFSFILIPIVLITVYLFFKKGKQFFALFSRIELTALYLSLLPAAIFIPFMPRWSAEHDYSMLRLSTFLIILLVILLNKLPPPLTRNKKIVFITLLAVVFTGHIYIFNTKFANGRKSDFYKKTGEAVKNITHDDDVIFSINNLESGIDPRFLIYIQRNVQSVKSKEEAVDALKAYQKQKGVIVYIDKKEGFLNFERITARELY